MGGKAIIIDDHRLFGAGMKALVTSLPQIDEATYYETPEVALLHDFDVNLVMADFYIPGYPAKEWLPRIKTQFSQAPLVVVSSSHSRADRDLCERIGAAAFFEKHLHPERFVDQIERLLQGNEPDISSPNDPTGRLTPRQLDIIVELSRGSQAKSIARHFDLSPETVKSHLSRLYKELKVSGREEAVQWARENGVI